MDDQVITNRICASKCKLYKNASRYKIDSVIPTQDETLIAFIAEAPGETEEQKNRPLVGPAGQNLNEALRIAGIDRSTAFVGNVCRCRPKDNRTPNKREMQSCFPFLLEELKTIKPKVIVTLGLAASKTLLRNDKLKMKDSRGKFVQGKMILGFDCSIMPTYHPSPNTFKYSPGRKGEMQKDIKKAWAKATGAITMVKRTWASVVITNYEMWQTVLPVLHQADHLTFDLETTGLNFNADDAYITNLGMAISPEFGLSVITPDEWGQETFSAFLTDLKGLMDTKPVVAHNLPYDAKYIKKQWGIWPKIWHFDTAMGHAIIKPGESTRYGWL